MNIIEDENKTSDTNQAVCSVTEGHQLYPLIVTFRCQANTQRIEVNLRSGILSQGHKGSAASISYPLKAHRRIQW